MNQFDSTSPRDALRRLVEIGSMVLLSKYFHHFVIISLWKRAGPFIWTNLNPCYPRMLCARFDWKLAQWFWIRRWNYEKFTTTMTTTTTTTTKTDNGQIFWSGKAHLNLRLKRRGYKWFYHKLACLYTFNLIYIFKANLSFFHKNKRWSLSDDIDQQTVTRVAQST